MAKKTKQMRNLETLEALGWRQVPTRSSKYICLKHHMFEDTSLVFLGKAGAVRGGKNASTSFATSLDHVVRKTKLLEIQGI